MQACSRHPVQTRNSGGTRFPTALQHVCELGRFGHMDQSEEFWRIAGEKATFLAIPTEQLNKLRSAQILRSHASKTAFLRAAVEVAKNVSQLRSFVASHRRDYVQPGRLEEVEREKVEEQVAIYVRSCTANIAKLEALIERAEGATPQVNVYQHGVVLILSERLQSISASFDACRSLRYQQLQTQRQRQQWRQKELQQAKANSLPKRPKNWEDHSAVPSQSGTPPLQTQAQQQIEEENRALQAELQSLGQQVRETEKSMSEISALSQMFSQQVSMQSEKTLQLYNQAVEASELVAKGNINLQKAIRLNSSTRKFMFYFFMLASLLLLFFDWWSS